MIKHGSWQVSFKKTQMKNKHTHTHRDFYICISVNITRAGNISLVAEMHLPSTIVSIGKRRSVKIKKRIKNNIITKQMSTHQLEILHFGDYIYLPSNLKISNNIKITINLSLITKCL